MPPVLLSSAKKAWCGSPTGFEMYRNGRLMAARGQNITSWATGPGAGDWTTVPHFWTESGGFVARQAAGWAPLPT